MRCLLGPRIGQSSHRLRAVRTRPKGVSASRESAEIATAGRESQAGWPSEDRKVKEAEKEAFATLALPSRKRPPLLACCPHRRPHGRWRRGITTWSVAALMDLLSLCRRCFCQSPSFPSIPGPGTPTTVCVSRCRRARRSAHSPAILRAEQRRRDWRCE